MAEVKLHGYRCERCNHTWIPRRQTKEKKALPIVCPHCKSPYWNTPRRKKGGKRSKK